MYRTIMCQFRNCIKEQREQSRLTLAELSRLTRIPRATIHDYEEHHTNPTGDALKKLCKVFKCNLSELLKQDCKGTC
jgi:transcriptional regulator with XRE-family HTH domain